jgi:hypothetical protein
MTARTLPYLLRSDDSLTPSENSRSTISANELYNRAWSSVNLQDQLVMKGKKSGRVVGHDVETARVRATRAMRSEVTEIAPPNALTT